MSLYEESVRHQVMLEGYKEDQTNEALLVVPVLLAALTADLDGARVDNIRELSYPQLQRLIKRVKSGQVKASLPMQRKILVALKDLAESEYGFQSRSLENNDLTAPPSRSRTELYDEAEENPLSSDGSNLAAFLPFWALANADRIGNAVQRAWADDIPNSVLVSQVRGTRAQNYRNGVLGTRFRRSLSFTLSTAIQHVSSTARITAMRLSPSVRAYRWASVLDSRTTAICRSLDGRVFNFGEGPRPPAHPGCRSTIVAVRKGESDKPTRQTYYTWLKRQPKGFQEEVLGPVRTKLFREDSMTASRFADLNLNRYFRPRTLKEMERVEPIIFDKAGIDP